MRLGSFGRDAAGGENPREKIRMAVDLGNGERPALPCLVEPLAPGPAERRTFNAEKKTRFAHARA